MFLFALFHGTILASNFESLMFSTSVELTGLIGNPGISSKQTSSFQIAAKESVSSRPLRSTIFYRGHILHMRFHLVIACMPQEPI